MAVSPSGDPPDEAQAIDATCTIRLPDTATVLVHDTTERFMWRRVTRVPPSTESVSDLMEGLREPVVARG
jgi:hypothetical protein